MSNVLKRKFKVKKPKLTIVETFVGCGGAHLGFKNNNFESLLVNDIDKDMIATLIKNNCVNEAQTITCPVEELTSDIIKSKINKDVDVLFGGIVCKGFSLAGVRNPFDNRNYLYEHQLRLVKLLKPKVSIIENVVGFKNMILYRKNNETISVFNKYTELSDKNKQLNGEKSSRRKEKKTYDDLNQKIKEHKDEMELLLQSIENHKYNIFDEIKSIYEDIGYKVYNKVLDASKYNGFTHRKRLIIVAVRNDIEKEYVYPQEQNEFTLIDALNKIDYNGINNPEVDIDNQSMNHNEKTVSRFKLIPEGKNIAEVMDDIPEELKISKFYSRGNTQRLDRNKTVPTLVPGHSNFPIHPWEHRSITVREASTITGFPLDYKFVGSHSARCMQIGNAVPVYLADAIAKSIRIVLL
jgi:DNA (cytosine-5)-methyltransferase 1